MVASPWARMEGTLGGRTDHVRGDAVTPVAPTARRRSRPIRLLSAIGFAMLLVLALPAAALGESWTPTPLPSIAKDSATGYPGYEGGVPGYWPKGVDTDDYPDSQSCQRAVNDAIAAVTYEIRNIPASTTQEQHAFANAVDASIKAQIAELQELRRICLAKPAGPPTEPPEPYCKRKPCPPVQTPPNAKYAVIPLVCPGYSTCAVQGEAILDAATKFFKKVGALFNPSAERGAKRTPIGRASFSVDANGDNTVKVPLKRRARKVLKARGSLRVRLTLRVSVEDGPVQTTRTKIKLKPKKR
jgi:hypothetical protein